MTPAASKTNSDEKMRLELKGEKATNGIRLLIILIFIGATISGLRTGVIEGIEAFYLTGLTVFSLPFFISVIVVHKGLYRPWMKYWGMLLEVVGYFIVNLGYVYMEQPYEWLGAVNNPIRHAIWYLILGIAALRFSPRISVLAGVSCATAYAVLHVILLSRPEIILITKGLVQPGQPQVSALQMVMGTIFLIVMGAIIALAGNFIRGLLDTAQKSEGDARVNLENVTNLVAEGARIGRDLNQAVSNIRGVTTANEELSRDQLASIEETSAAMEQMSASIQAIALQAKTQDDLCDRNAQSMRALGDMTHRIESLTKQANAQGEKTLERTLLGEKALENALEGIQRIQEGSVQVAEIVTVINGIADKTNLLALNAAIEAARAGAEGRGFSVVADEVGKLAELSSNNARIIEELITGTRTDTELGVHSIEETVKSLKGVTTGIKSIVSSVGEVYKLVVQQSRSAGEVVEETEKIQTIALDMKNATSEQLEGAREIMNAVNTINSVADKFARNYAQLMDAAEVLAGPAELVRLGARGDEELVEGQRLAAVDELELLVLAVDAPDPALDQVDAALGPDVVLVGLRVLVAHVAHEHVHERGPRVGVLRLARDHGDAPVGAQLAQAERGRESGDARRRSEHRGG